MGSHDGGIHSWHVGSAQSNVQVGDREVILLYLSADTCSALLIQLVLSRNSLVVSLQMFLTVLSKFVFAIVASFAV